MKKNTVLYLLLAGLLLLFFSCSSAETAKEELRTEVKKTAEEVNTSFMSISKAVVELAAHVTSLYNNRANYDLSTDKMDEQNGGKYKFFEGVQYYKAKDDGGCAILVTGAVPVDEAIKQEVRLLENAEAKIKATKESSPDIALAWVFSKNSVALSNPWIDIVSAAPPKLDIPKMPWWTIVTPEQNPEKKHKWTPPIVGVAGGVGFMKTVVAPAISTAGTMEAIGTSDVAITGTVKKYIGSKESMIMLLAKDTTLLGASPKAKETLKLKVLEEFNYVEQIKVNPEASKDLQLVSPTQTEDLRALADKLLKGEKEFEVKVDGKSYFVTTAEVPEAEFILVGVLAL